MVGWQWLSKKETLLLFVISLIPFVFYLFRPLAWHDSYAFLAGACGLNSVYVVPFMPCNEIVIKLVLFGLYFVAILGVGLWGKNSVANGWKVGLFAAGFSPLLFQLGSQFENDVFGWAIPIAVCFPLLALYHLKPRNKDKLIIAFLVLIISIFFSFSWIGVLLLPIGFSLTAFLLLVGAIPLAYWGFGLFAKTFLNQIQLINHPVAEEVMGAVVPAIAFLTPGLLDIPRKYLAPALFFFVIGFVKIKYAMFCVPFLAMGLVELENKNKDRFKHWPNTILLCFIFAFMFGFLFLGTEPIQQQLDLAEQGVGLSLDSNIPLFNDWSYGWWIEYSGYSTEFKASWPNPDWNSLTKPYLAYTSESLGCSLISEAKETKLFICN